MCIMGKMKTIVVFLRKPAGVVARLRVNVTPTFPGSGKVRILERRVVWETVHGAQLSLQ